MVVGLVAGGGRGGVGGCAAGAAFQTLGLPPHPASKPCLQPLQGVVDVMLSTLDKRERNVLRLRYGLLG